jgi:hypothetical protein
MTADVSQVSALGPDPLKDISADISIERASAQRRAVESEIVQARKEERAFRETRRGHAA